MTKQSVHLSHYLGISHKEFIKHGVYDALIGEDSLLHIDPLLLRNTEIQCFIDGYQKFLKRFTDTARLVQFVKSENISDRFYDQICKRLTFKEIANTGLGFSKSGGHGTGISGILTKQLANSVIEIERAGIIDPEIYALMPIFEENIGPDRISDMIISILFDDFVRYTSSTVENMGITRYIKIVNYKFGKFKMPIYKNRTIIFIPQSFLCELPEAQSWEDIERVENYNQRIRERVCVELGIALKEAKKIKKNELKNYILTDNNLANNVLAYYKSLTGIPYDFSNDKLGEYIQAKVNEMTFPKNLSLPSEANLEDVKNVTVKICNHYKSEVENNRMYKLFRDSKTDKYSETKAQLLFYCMADSYCQANNIDLTRESDAGIGELDFKLSKGAIAKVLIEMKLSSNTQLEKGLSSQLPAYMKSEKGHIGILMIILTHDRDLSRVSHLMNQYYTKVSDNYAMINLIIIDARNRSSASKLR